MNAFGSPIVAQERAQDIVRGGEALVATDENVREDLRVVLRVSLSPTGTRSHRAPVAQWWNIGLSCRRS